MGVTRIATPSTMAGCPSPVGSPHAQADDAQVRPQAQLHSQEAIGRSAAQVLVATHPALSRRCALVIYLVTVVAAQLLVSALHLLGLPLLRRPHHQPPLQRRHQSVELAMWCIALGLTPDRCALATSAAWMDKPVHLLTTHGTAALRVKRRIVPHRILVIS